MNKKNKKKTKKYLQIEAKKMVSTLKFNRSKTKPPNVFFVI